MKVFVICFLTVVAVALARPNEEKYTIKYDDVDVDEILKSDRLTKNYVDCLLDVKPCTPDGKELKRVLPDALKNKCSKCSEAQRVGARKVLHNFYHDRPNYYNSLKAKYDPEGTYEKENAEELKKL